MRENYQPLAHTAADKHWSHLDYFTELLNGEAAQRKDRRVQRCIRQARFPVIKTIGADCLFQIISHRYERGATLLTTNRPYKQWAGIFDNDATLTSALLDRLLDHVETVVIEGKSYRGQSHAEI